MKTWGLYCEKAAPGIEVGGILMEKTGKQELCAGSIQRVE